MSPGKKRCPGRDDNGEPQSGTHCESYPDTHRDQCPERGRNPLQPRRRGGPPQRAARPRLYNNRLRPDRFTRLAGLDLDLLWLARLEDRHFNVQHSVVQPALDLIRIETARQRYGRIELTVGELRPALLFESL